MYSYMVIYVRQNLYADIEKFRSLKQNGIEDGLRHLVQFSFLFFLFFEGVFQIGRYGNGEEVLYTKKPGKDKDFAVVYISQLKVGTSTHDLYLKDEPFKDRTVAVGLFMD